MPTPVEKSSKYQLAFRVGTAAAPIILGLLAGYVYDIRPMVHDVCEALLPFGTMAHPSIPLPVEVEADAGAPR